MCIMYIVYVKGLGRQGRKGGDEVEMCPCLADFLLSFFNVILQSGLFMTCNIKNVPKNSNHRKLYEFELTASKNGSIFRLANKVGTHLTVYVNNWKGRGCQVSGDNYRRNI